ncbi:MAG: hypothetical protein RIC35_14295 [Marinoscillum sp.]
MNIKKTLKVSGYVLIGMILITGILLTLFYYQYQGKYPVNAEKYAHNVGYIDPSTALQSNVDFKLCDDGQLVGFYHSAAPNIYKGTKYKFRKYVLSNFQNRDFKDSGFLNLRFHINCHGQVGNLEVNVLNEDFEEISMMESLVDQIVKLIARPENWETFAGEEHSV